MSAYRKGVEACKTGLQQGFNPYVRDSLSWHDWNRGWQDQFHCELAGQPTDKENGK